MAQMFSANYSVKIYGSTPKILKNTCDKIVYTIARVTLDTSVPSIPRNTGRMRSSSLAKGVTGSNMNYQIGSYTSYAKTVWFYGSNTNWTTPGTFGKWYETVFKRYNSVILRTAVERNKL